MRKQSSVRELVATAGGVRLSRLLIMAAALHLSLAIALSFAARQGLLPAHLDARGVGISFAVDSLEYLNESARLVQVLEQEGAAAWARADAALHVKLYSLSQALLGRWLGFTTLSAEPLNLFYYLLIVTLVFALGREAFDRGTGILAASVTALWPSLLLHTTQLLRDPLFLTLFLTIMLVSVSWLTRGYSWRGGLLSGIAGGAASALLWLVRSQMWEVLLCAVLLSATLLLARQILERRFMAWNVMSFALVCAVVVALPVAAKAFKVYSSSDVRRGAADFAASETAGRAASSTDNGAATVPPRSLPPGSPTVSRISLLRQKFLSRYPTAGSNLDAHVRFDGLSDILLYLPRAALIGLLAPFPNSWFVRGAEAGREGRLLAGFEMALIYLVEALAAFALWRRPRRIQAWLLLLVSLGGVLALALVVPNLAALYRMRYGFWLLLIILGAEGLRQIFIPETQRRRA